MRPRQPASENLCDLRASVLYPHSFNEAEATCLGKFRKSGIMLKMKPELQ